MQARKDGTTFESRMSVSNICGLIEITLEFDTSVMFFT